MLETGTKVFGEWLIDEKIGSGAFGTVYKIKREEFGEVYYAALKVINIPQDPQDQMRLRSEGMDDESITTYYGQLAQNFVQEIKLLSTLDGITNIVDYKDHSIVPNDSFGYTIYIKMQLLTPLSKLLVDKDGKALFLSQNEALKVGIDICSALELCEKQKIIHRDIKVDNIFVSSNGDYKLGDFGIAKQLESTQGEMSKKGTMMYMAPEVFKGENYDNTADIYSLGIVLYRLLNKNRAPFFPAYPTPIKFSDKENANMKRLSGDVALPAIPGVSDELMAILRKSCAYNPAYRFKSATELKNALIELKTVGTFNYKSTAENIKVASSQRVAFGNKPSMNNSAPSNPPVRPAMPNANPKANPKANTINQNNQSNMNGISQMPSPNVPQQRVTQQKPSQPKVIHPKSLQGDGVNEIISQSQNNIYKRKNNEIQQPAGIYSGRSKGVTKQQGEKQFSQQINAIKQPTPQFDDSSELEQTMGVFSDMPMPVSKQPNKAKPVVQKKENPVQYTTPQINDDSDELEQTMGVFSELPSAQINTTNIEPKKKSSKGKIIAIIISILTFLGISSTVIIAIIAILLSSSGY